MKKMIIIAFLLFGYTAFAQDDEEIDTYKKNFMKFIKVSGANNIYDNMGDLLLKYLNTIKVSLPDSVKNELVEEFTKAKPQMVQIKYEIFKKYYTEKELIELINFYQTPTGKKFANNTNIVLNETYQEGAKLGEKIAQRVLKKYGYIK